MEHLDDPQEWLRLNQHYQQMDDTDLLELRDDFEDLTPIAQDVLRSTLKARGLWQSQPTSPPPTPVKRQADYLFLRSASVPQESDVVDRDSLLMDTGVAVRACESLDDASLLSDLLKENKIESVVITTKRGYPVRFPEIMVFPEDVDRASDLIDRADLESLRVAASESGPVTEESSKCPGCGSSEILLQPARADCLNVWICGNCGRSWQDNLPSDWQTRK